ncbi:DUF1642 domain-containing protein [Enterococcus faecalis]
MNKQELIEKYKTKYAEEPKDWRLTSVNTSRQALFANFINDLGQLDEPKKVVVPKFVAEWLDKHKYSTNIIDLFSNVEYATDSDGFIAGKWEYRGEFYDWLSDNADTLFTLCDAVRYGYEVEKEQLYYVKLPDLGYLVRHTKNGHQFINTEILENSRLTSKFTENQIKAIDERYWPFAVKVDGE